MANDNTKESSSKVPAQTIKSAQVNQRALRKIRARIIGVKKLDEASSGQSQALPPEEPYGELVKSDLVIQPPFDLLTLSMLVEHNTELGQCVDAMVNNIEGFGHRYVPRESAAKADLPSKLAKAVKRERTWLTNWFTYACLQDSFTAFRSKLRKDLETTGNCCWEIIRDARGKPQGFVHIPSYQLRLAHLDDEPIEVEMPILELQEDDSVKIVKVKVWKRFRRYVQAKIMHTRNLTYVSGTHEVRWFKEYGDPRTYNNRTGKEVTDKAEIAKLPITKRANELVHRRLYTSRSPYGLPRYIGNLLSIFGDRAAEEINYITFRNNNIPSMVVTVSNGQLTQESVDRVKEFVESQIQGSDNYSKFLIIEGETFFEGDEGGQVKVDVKPLTKEQHKDALFQKYSENNQDKIRRCFRLPPIFVGISDDYTRATAESSRRLADEQIFAPERSEFDSWINRILFPEMDIVYHEFKSNSPNTTDNTELVKILAGAEKTGGMTPRIARLMLSDILGLELPGLPADFPADVPFSLTMAEAVKNQAEVTEPGQQVTALKMIDQLTKSDIPIFNTDEAMIRRLLKMRNLLEKKWAHEVFESEEEEGEAEIE